MSEIEQPKGGSGDASADTTTPASSAEETKPRAAQNPMANDDYTVGPGRPPKETRFKKGVSGNPSGRRKREDGFWGLFHDVAYGKVRAKDGGEFARIEVVLRQLFADAIKGEKRARTECLGLMMRYSPPPPPTNDNAAVSAAEDRAVIEAFVESLLIKNRRSERGGDGDE